MIPTARVREVSVAGWAEEFGSTASTRYLQLALSSTASTEGHRTVGTALAHRGSAGAVYLLKPIGPSFQGWERWLMIVDHRIAETRICAWDVLHHMEYDGPVEEIADMLGLSNQQEQAAVDFIQAHGDEVMKVHQQIEERNAQGNPPNIQSKLDAARARRWSGQSSGRRSPHGDERTPI